MGKVSRGPRSTPSGPAGKSHPIGPVGFEDDAAVLSRVLPALDRIAETESPVSDGATATVLIVTHGGVLRALDRLYEVEQVPIPNLAGRWFHHDETFTAGNYVELASEISNSDVE